MATRRPARRTRDALRVYDRGGTWWAHVPGRGRGRERVSLGLAVADVPHDEAYRVAAARLGSGALATRSAEGRCEALSDLSERFVAAHADRWAKRQGDNAVYRLDAFIGALETQGVRTITAVTDDVLERWVREERARRARGSTECITASTINRTIQLGHDPDAVDLLALPGVALAERRAA